MVGGGVGEEEEEDDEEEEEEDDDDDVRYGARLYGCFRRLSFGRPFSSTRALVTILQLWETTVVVVVGVGVGWWWWW